MNIDDIKDYPSVAVITPTIGSEELAECIESISRQIYKNIIHYVVVDGQHFLDKVNSVLSKVSNSERVKLVVLPENTGGQGYYGHRVYGAFPYLVNSDFVSFLDEDNWFDDDHISKLVDLVLEKKLEWAYSLRKVMSKNGDFICNDDCDSLGIWGKWLSEQNHIDANCYFLKRELAIRSSTIWNRKGYSSDILNPDKALCRWLLNNELKGYTTGSYTMNYRLGSSDNSATTKYFLDGNIAMRNKYKYFPWTNGHLHEIRPAINFRRIIYSEPA